MDSVNSTTLGVHKRGDTFSYIVAIVESRGYSTTPVINKTANFRSQVRRKFDRKLMTELVPSETAIPGTYQFLCIESTQSWQPGEYIIDIQYTDNNIITSSKTFSLTVVEDVTYD